MLSRIATFRLNTDSLLQAMRSTYYASPWKPRCSVRIGWFRHSMQSKRRDPHQVTTSRDKRWYFNITVFTTMNNQDLLGKINTYFSQTLEIEITATSDMEKEVSFIGGWKCWLINNLTFQASKSINSPWKKINNDRLRIVTGFFGTFTIANWLWAVFKWLSKVITRLWLPRSVIGLKISRQLFNQWEANPNIGQI